MMYVLANGTATGDPLEMWEPKRALMNTQALLDWDERLSREA